MGCHACLGLGNKEKIPLKESKKPCFLEIGTSLYPCFFINISSEEENSFYMVVNINSIKEAVIDKILYKKGTITIIQDNKNPVSINLKTKDRKINNITENGLNVLIIEIFPEDGISSDNILYPYMNQDRLKLENKEITIGENPNLESKIKNVSVNTFSFEVNKKEEKMIKSGDPIFLKDNQKVIGIIKPTYYNDNDIEYEAVFIWNIQIKEEKFKDSLKFLEDGGSYVGQLTEKGVPNSRGRYTFKNEESYDGEILFDNFEGKGLYQYKDFYYYYIGQFKKNLRDGKGTIYYANDNILYEGDFVNDKFEGEGIYYWKNGEYYIGHFKNGLANGKGKLYYDKGNIKYEGDFVNDKFEGNGKYIYDNGYYYIGQFKNGVKEGKGKLYYPNGKIEYEGDFLNGKFEGKGKYIYENGEYYVGEFKDGMCHGKGIEYDSKGNVLLEGEWENDEKK